MRKKSIEEDLNTHPSVPSSNRLSRFLPSCKFASLTVCFFQNCKTIFTKSYLFFPGTNLLFLQRFCTRNTATSPSIERSRGSKGRSRAQRRRGSGRRALMGSRLHQICPHPAPFAHREALLLHCGRIYLMFEAAGSSTTSATKKGNYRRWVKYYVSVSFHLYFTLTALYKAELLLLSKLRQSLSWWRPRRRTFAAWQSQWTTSCYHRSSQTASGLRKSSGSSPSCPKSKMSVRGEVTRSWRPSVTLRSACANISSITSPSLSLSSLVACRFLQDLEHRLEEDILRFDVCDIVLDHCPSLRRVYLPYVTNQAYQEQTYQRLLWV